MRFWIAVSNDSVAVPDLHINITERSMNFGDVLTAPDGRNFICYQSGYTYEPTMMWKRPAMVVPARRKTPMEIINQ